LTKLTNVDDKSKKYIEVGDQDSKIKKAFDLVLLIAKSKKITVVAVELMKKFLDTYSDIIQAYDKQNKDIYVSRIKDAIQSSITMIDKETNLKNKMNILK
jgi:hypothetical protein